MLVLAAWLVASRCPSAASSGRSGPATVSRMASFTATAGQGRRVVTAQPVLVIVLGIAFAAGMWAEGFDRLRDAHFLIDVGLPEIGSLDNLAWFGVFGAGTLLLSFVVAAPLVSRVEKLDQAAAGPLPRSSCTPP